MIKHIYGNSQWVTVGNNGTAMPYINTTQQMAGMLRWNSIMGKMEVYDGNSWMGFGGDAHVDLSEHAKQALLWVKEKMTEEARLKELMERHPGLRDAYERLEIMKALVIEQENNET